MCTPPPNVAQEATVIATLARPVSPVVDKEPETDEAVPMGAEVKLARSKKLSPTKKLTWCRLGTGASHFGEGFSTVPRVPMRSEAQATSMRSLQLGSWKG